MGGGNIMGRGMGWGRGWGSTSGINVGRADDLYRCDIFDIKRTGLLDNGLLPNKYSESGTHISVSF
jgi:hypothetical protein